MAVECHAYLISTCIADRSNIKSVRAVSYLNGLNTYEAVIVEEPEVIFSKRLVQNIYFFRSASDIHLGKFALAVIVSGRSSDNDFRPGRAFGIRTHYGSRILRVFVVPVFEVDMLGAHHVLPLAAGHVFVIEADQLLVPVDGKQYLACQIVGHRKSCFCNSVIYPREDHHAAEICRCRSREIHKPVELVVYLIRNLGLKRLAVCQDLIRTP